jgi:hypothetical protein
MLIWNFTDLKNFLALGREVANCSFALYYTPLLATRQLYHLKDILQDLNGDILLGSSLVRRNSYMKHSLFVLSPEFTHKELDGLRPIAVRQIREMASRN